MRGSYLVMNSSRNRRLWQRVSGSRRACSCESLRSFSELSTGPASSRYLRRMGSSWRRASQRERAVVNEATAPTLPLMTTGMHTRTSLLRSQLKWGQSTGL